MYHWFVPSLAHQVLAYIRKQRLLKAGDRAGVAVSGGGDSVALLRLLLELRAETGIILSVVHFNHRLRGAASDADEQFVADLARQYKLELHSAGADTNAYAAEQQQSTETAARELRYEFFRRLTGQARLNRIATAHTLDDQAETVLLKLARGSGTRGLAGIYPAVEIDDGSAIVRPLLAIRRKALIAYLGDLGQVWREDASNRDLRHTRNRVRHGILPRLERYLNPSIREALAETADIARAEEDYWQNEAAKTLPAIFVPEQNILNSIALCRLPLALQRRAVRAACDSLDLQLEFHQVEAILALAASRESRSVELSHGWIVSRQKHDLYFERGPKALSDYDYTLPVPGSVAVPEINSCFQTLLLPVGLHQPHNPDHLLKRALLGSQLRVRNWRPGDHFWPSHTKGPKKVKELLRVSGVQRKRWPVVVSENQIVWMRGFPVAANVRAETGSEALLIQETALP